MIEENLIEDNSINNQKSSELFTPTDDIEIDLSSASSDTQVPSVNENQNSYVEKRLPGRPKLFKTDEEEEEVGLDNKVFYDDASEQANFASISYREAVTGEHSDEWKESICKKIGQIIKRETFDIVNKPKHVNIIDSESVLSNKTDSKGNVITKKARLVARGFEQSHGIDYFQTFAPVMRLESLRILIALAAQFSLKLNQLDITSAFLHGDLAEKVYMKIPKYLDLFLEILVKNEKYSNIYVKAKDMIEKIKKPNQVCLLKKALYGLKQAGRVWNQKIDNIFKSLNLKASKAEPCLYYDINKNYAILIILYVDDMLIAYNNEKKLNDLKEKLKSKIEVKDLGEAKYCVGIEHINKIVENFNLADAKTTATPADRSSLYSLQKKEAVPTLPYQELIGSVMYLSVATRSDIMHSVVFLSQFNTSFDREYWSAAKRIVKYLKSTINYGLIFKKDEFEINGFVDADWGSNILDRKSFTGYVFKLGESAITWKSQKKKR
uniref:Reverse transcriptase Ty1/copia-type domain-containing protein n=1 Tax=Trichogramma kaykai TaxID=54128 RepID=A0ABD2WJW3_9HYME